MRTLFALFFTLSAWMAAAQTSAPQQFPKDSLIHIPANPQKGFYNDYLLFIPKGTPLQQELVLLVETNNTGRPTDSMAVHLAYAVDLASVSSVGNNVATELKIPLLVPVFPRPGRQPLIYTHALDRDVMLAQTPVLRRLDLQLVQMIRDAKAVLRSLQIPVESKIFMSGFSASASFANRFSLLHPHQIKALAIGGFNGELMLPLPQLQGVVLDYPIGTHDFKKRAGQPFDLEAFRQLPQFIYMGALDDNDAVQFDDAYSEQERKLINKYIGRQVQERYAACQQIYNGQHMQATFVTYDSVGHWTTPEMNLAVIRFFKQQLQKK